MTRAPSFFLRAVVVLIGIGALAFLLWQPHVEGRNADATVFEIYFKDPFLAFIYVGSVPFFVGLYHAFKVLGYAGRSSEISPSTVRSLRTIKRSAILLVAFIAVGEAIIISGPEDDHAGPVAIGIVIAFASIVVATAMAVLERSMQNAVDLKSEHDLTV